mmetsp:Transcript_2055/g.2670  ORF Transcript_2055/g.2670 Transcript_2055/m.2670 type:complete len:159 (-) Transcript_2055:544-1020(-)
MKYPNHVVVNYVEFYLLTYHHLDPTYWKYTHILCDVPCGAERHMMHSTSSTSSLLNYNSNSYKQNVKKQVSLLKAATHALSNNGILVYSTCSINVYENDGVIEKILQSRGDVIEVVEEDDHHVTFGVGEKTKYGWMILPDHASCLGMGPMYIAKLRKV